MATVSIDSTKAHSLLQKVQELFSPEQYDKIRLIAGERVGEMAIELLGQYPVASGKSLPVYYTRTNKDGQTYLSKFKSRKQQGFVFGVLVKKEKIPYERKGAAGLGGSITQKTTVTAESVKVVVGSNKEYASYVVGGEGEQSHYHTGTWKQWPDVIDANTGIMVQVFVDTLESSIRIGLNRT